MYLKTRCVTSEIISRISQFHFWSELNDFTGPFWNWMLDGLFIFKAHEFQELYTVHAVQPRHMIHIPILKIKCEKDLDPLILQYENVYERLFFYLNCPVKMKIYLRLVIHVYFLLIQGGGGGGKGGEIKKGQKGRRKKFIV